MVLTNLKGGLGNQRFQYAAGLAHAAEINTTHKIITKHFDYKNPLIKETIRKFELDYFNINYSLASEREVKQVKEPYGLFSKVLNLLNFYLQVHSFISFPIQVAKTSKNIFLDGHYQSEDFFIQYDNLIRKEFSLKKEFVNSEYKEIEKEIVGAELNSISLHIRRGDYVYNKSANQRHGTLDLDYYQRGLDYLHKHVGDLHVFLFSDDIDWVEDNLTFISDKKTYVSKHNFNSAQEITLMSRCSHNIIANSSFSWWGAWLNTNREKIVIAPSKWLRDGDGMNKRIVPTSWIRI